MKIKRKKRESEIDTLYSRTVDLERLYHVSGTRGSSPKFLTNPS